MKAETGIVADTLTTLHTHVTFKNEHVYVIHVARAPDGVAPRPSRELTQFKWMRDFANDFSTETKEAVHRRVLDDEFLTAVNAIHGNIARGAAAARRAVHVHATPTPTATPHQLPYPSQPNAGRAHQHANAPEQTHPNKSTPTARHRASDDAVTAVPELCGDDYQAGAIRAGRRTQTTPAPTQARTPARRRREYSIKANNRQPDQPQRAYNNHNNNNTYNNNTNINNNNNNNQGTTPEASSDRRRQFRTTHLKTKYSDSSASRSSQQQQHQPHQRDIQRQREQMAHINTVEAIRRSLADEHGDEDAAIARSIADEVDRQHEAARHKARTSSRSTPPAPPVATQVRKDSGGSRGEGSATSLDPKKLPRVSGNRNQSAPRDCDRTRHPLSDTHRVMRKASQRGERESRTRLDGPLKAPCGDGTPEGGAQIKDHES